MIADYKGLYDFADVVLVMRNIFLIVEFKMPTKEIKIDTVITIVHF